MILCIFKYTEGQYFQLFRFFILFKEFMWQYILMFHLNTSFLTFIF